MHSLTQLKQPPPSYSLSLSQLKQPPPFLLSYRNRHTAQARKTQIGLVPFFFKCTIKQFYLLSTNKSQIQHFIQQMQNNNPTPQIKQLQQFTQQFHMAKIYNNDWVDWLPLSSWPGGLVTPRFLTGWTGYPSVLDRVDWLPLGSWPGGLVTPQFLTGWTGYPSVLTIISDQYISTLVFIFFKWNRIQFKFNT